MDYPERHFKQENDFEEDPLAMDPLAGCEEGNEMKPVVESVLLRVKKEEAVEAEDEAGTSNERSEQVAFEEMKAEDANGSGNGSNRAESPSQECEAAKPKNKNIPSHSNRQLFARMHCSNPFEYKETLKEHEQEHREQPPLLSGDACQLQFTPRGALLPDSRVHVNKVERKISFPCETCGREFKCSSHLKRHILVHTGEKPFVCDHCGKSFAVRYNLNVHLRQHTGERPYSCSICNEQFAEHSTLVQHMRRHLDIKPYGCEECGKTFVQSSEYTRHIRVHTRAKPYNCSVCSMTFPLRKTLSNHMLTHSRKQNQMSECELCGESFRTTYINTHMRIHMGEKPHKCRFCDATFADGSNRVKHEGTHSDSNVVQCGECGKSVSSAQYLKVHLRCHTGEKPYKCGYCDKTFAQQTSHKRHETTHTKEYPYNCAKCGKGYRDKWELARHTQTHGN